ncbi:MAG: class I SAM-dependent methyltransferase [Deltaproteobacteria bacterium]|nr:class I SAM-dependent methyltransferase [Deltaproteobacteria bacterium]
MTNFFQDPEFTQLLDEQLQRQVDVPWPEEAECLQGHGMQAACRVLDVGTGNGYFLCRLAKQYPDKLFVGIDQSEQLIQAAEKWKQRLGVCNVEFMTCHCPNLEMSDLFDFAFARFCIYCAPNRRDVLSWALGRLKPGARFCVIDVDVDADYTDPPEPAWSDMIDAGRRAMLSGGSDRTIGKKLPALLYRAGFVDIRLEQRFWYSSFARTRAEFVGYWRSTGVIMRRLFADIYTQEMCDAFLAFMDRFEKGVDTVITNPIHVISGKKQV